MQGQGDRNDGRINLSRVRAFERLADDICRHLDHVGRADRPITLHMPMQERFDPRRLVRTFADEIGRRLKLDNVRYIHDRSEQEIEDSLLETYLHDVDGLVIEHGDALSKRSQEMFAQCHYPFGRLTLVLTSVPPARLAEDLMWTPSFHQHFHRGSRLAWPVITQLDPDERWTLFQYGIAKRALEINRETPRIEVSVRDAVRRHPWTVEEGARCLVQIAKRCVDIFRDRGRMLAVITRDMLDQAFERYYAAPESLLLLSAADRIH